MDKRANNGTLLKNDTLRGHRFVIKGSYASSSQIRCPWDSSPCDDSGDRWSPDISGEERDAREILTFGSGCGIQRRIRIDALVALRHIILFPQSQIPSQPPVQKPGRDQIFQNPEVVISVLVAYPTEPVISFSEKEIYPLDLGPAPSISL